MFIVINWSKEKKTGLKKFDPKKTLNPNIYLALVVQRVDNAIHWINQYPVDGVVSFVNIYLLDSGLSSG